MKPFCLFITKDLSYTWSDTALFTPQIYSKQAFLTSNIMHPEKE